MSLLLRSTGLRGPGIYAHKCIERCRNSPWCTAQRWKAYRPRITPQKEKQRAFFRQQFYDSREERMAFEQDVAEIHAAKLFKNPYVPKEKIEKQEYKITDFESLRRLRPYSSVDLSQNGYATNVSVPQAARIMNCLSSPWMSEQEVIFKISVKLDMTRQSCRGILKLPHITGQVLRLAVLCPQEMAAELIEAGADYAGEQDLIDKIVRGFLDFDKCITSADMMPRIMPLARILGPRKLMPNKKSETIVVDLPPSGFIKGTTRGTICRTLYRGKYSHTLSTEINVQGAVRAAKTGSSVEYRADEDATVSLVVGKLSNCAKNIVDNCLAITEELVKQRPPKQLGDDDETFFVKGSLQIPGLLTVPIHPEMLMPDHFSWSSE